MVLCVIFSPLLSDDYVGTEDWTDYAWNKRKPIFTFV